MKFPRASLIVCLVWLGISSGQTNAPDTLQEVSITLPSGPFLIDRINDQTAHQLFYVKVDGQRRLVWENSGKFWKATEVISAYEQQGTVSAIFGSGPSATGLILVWIVPDSDAPTRAVMINRTMEPMGPPVNYRLIGLNTIERSPVDRTSPKKIIKVDPTNFSATMDGVRLKTDLFVNSWTMAWPDQFGISADQIFAGKYPPIEELMARKQIPHAQPGNRR